MTGRTRPPPPPRPQGQERRREPRVDCRVRVEARAANGPPCAGWTLDLSLGGACLELSAPFVVGHRVQLRLHLPGAPNPLEALADVRWVRDLAGGLFLVGVSLLTLPSADAARLRAYLDAAT